RARSKAVESLRPVFRPAFLERAAMLRRSLSWFSIPFCFLFIIGSGSAQQNPKVVDPPLSVNPSSDYDRALKLLQEGKAAEALAVIDGALISSPNDPSLYNLRGLAMRQLRRPQEAEASFRKVIELSPRSAQGCNNLGALYSELGRHVEAQELFREALKREP